MTNNSDHIFSNVDIRKLLIPIMLENLLASLMGTVDTMMVSNVGASAVSAVSLVDSINILVIQALWNGPIQSKACCRRCNPVFPVHRKQQP